ncbi:hypothetical protein HYS00_01905 [Candidatus Microgenomates bacterium]|nr:hypothetical protein [Candidatus Microgenomates bacterium]
MREIIGVIAVVISLISLLPYISDIVRNKTKPHLYTWLVWTPLTFLAFFAQWSDNAGPGSWTTGVTAVICLVILVLAFSRGTKDITKSDTYCLVGAFIALGLWFFIKNPTASIILVTLIDILGFVPTLRKTYHKPHEETLVTYELNFAKHALSIGALSRLSILTALYPAAVAVANGVMVAVMIVRRRQTKR